MAGCSLHRPRPPGLLPPHHLASILIFQRVGGGWVREVHLHASKRKKGKSFVLFRNPDNHVVAGLRGLTRHLEEQGEDSSFLQWTNFLSERAPAVVSNKVGANKRARRAASEWMAEVLRAPGRWGEDDPWRRGSSGRRVSFAEPAPGGPPSLGTVPTTPGAVSFPRPPIDIVINSCEVGLGSLLVKL
jgi:hypothetical protein